MKKKQAKKSTGAMKAAIAVKIVAGVCAALGWWGVLYPELTMTPDTYAVISEETVQGSPEVIEWDFDSDIFWKLLETDGSRISFRSRLLQELRHALPKES